MRICILHVYPIIFIRQRVGEDCTPSDDHLIAEHWPTISFRLEERAEIYLVTNDVVLPNAGLGIALHY